MAALPVRLASPSALTVHWQSCAHRPIHSHRWGNEQEEPAMTTDVRAIYDEVATELMATSPTTSGKLFGMPCLKTNGKAFAGYYQDAMVFKLTTPEHTEALALPGAQLFDPS